MQCIVVYGTVGTTSTTPNHSAAGAQAREIIALGMRKLAKSSKRNQSAKGSAKLGGLGGSGRLSGMGGSVGKAGSAMGGAMVSAAGGLKKLSRGSSSAGLSSSSGLFSSDGLSSNNGNSSARSSFKMPGFGLGKR